MDIVSSMRFQNASTNTRRYSSWKLPVVLSQMQAWNIDLRTTTKYICYQRARRSDAEPVTHEVLSPVVIGFFIQYTTTACPARRGKKKTVAGQVVFVRSTYISLRRFWEIKAAGSFCLSEHTIVCMAATRRMPPCAWYSIDRSILTYQKKPCSRTGSAGVLLCTIQCSYCAFRAVIMPSWPFSVCWAFLLPSENLPVSKNIFGNFQKSG